MADDLRARYAEALAAAISRAPIVVLGDITDLGQPPATTEMDLADAVMAVRDAELERLRVAVDPAKVDAVRRLVASATRLVQVERDDARKRAEKAEAAVARVRALAARWGTTDPGLRDELLAALDGEDGGRG